MFKHVALCVVTFPTEIIAGSNHSAAVVESGWLFPSFSTYWVPPSLLPTLVLKVLVWKTRIRAYTAVGQWCLQGIEAES